ncbi:N-acetylmuramoyl-L-alanine amidase [bacterium]|nr:N-acetylmuramoyl-L-alanine amidase [bacterium]
MRWWLTVAAVLAVALAPAAPQKPLAGKVICLDPGHPSENGSGARGKSIGEVRANWLVAVQLKKLLQDRGAKVVLTKTREQENVTNRRRATIANNAKAALMVRLHCDSGGGAGLAIYYPDRQGKVQGVSGPSRQVITASARVAKAMYPVIVRALAGRVKAKGLRTDAATYVGSRQGGALTGSIFSRVPVVCIEMVTLSHRSDDSFMATESGRAAMAKAIASGIVAGLK